jgi:transcriptional regulator with XRE-family HTH domain
MPESEEKNFDGNAFYAAIASTVVARGITWKQVGQETGVSATTLTRMAQGRRPDAGSLAALSAWAGLNPGDYVNLRQRSAIAEPLARISSLLRSDPRLKPEAAVALEAMLQSAYERLKTSGAAPEGGGGVERAKPRKKARP